MQSSLLKMCAVFVLTAFALMAQSDRGTVTGTVRDSSGGVVPNVAVLLKNSATGVEFPTVTTETGNFTLPSIPAGLYELSASAPGFGKLTQSGLQVQVALTIRVDLALKVGNAADSVTVTAEAPMLRTENAESSVNIQGDRINELPLNFGGGAGAIGAIRNQMAFVVLSPGVAGSGTGARVNGFAGNSFRVMIDGQDTTSGNTQSRVDETAASVEAIQEFTLQTSNFAAEYGQALGGLFNFTIRSGTNSTHGSLFEYLTNEALNSRTPYTHLLPVSRKHDFGGTIGGPIRIPKVYDGRNKTFYFFNWEYFRNKVAGSGNYVTVPTDAFRGGNFSSILTGRNLGTDGRGNAIFENTVYDPATNTTINGATYRNPFPGNIIPLSRVDPVAAKIQAFIPAPINTQLVNNWLQNGVYVKTNSAPAFKIDHQFDQNDKVSFYYGYLTTNQKSSFDSLPDPITATRVQNIFSHTSRLNYDKTVKPTLLVHMGFGYIRYFNPDSASEEVLGYDSAGKLGFKGSATGLGFPRIGAITTGNYGGMGLGMGPANANYYWNDKVTAVASVAYIRNNHSFKLGAEMRVDTWTDRNTRGATGNLNFGASETGLPALTQLSQNLPGGTSVGHSYASFLLGAVNNATVNAVQDPQWRKTSWGMYLQDTWKLTRKLTMDYGLRWDYEDAGHEIWNRASTLGFSTPNPGLGGIKGALIYAGYGPNRCNCSLAEKYPYAIGPRLAFAYQIDPKTVLRTGWGIVYGQLAGLNYITNQTWYGVGFDQVSFTNPTPGEPGAILRNGLSYNIPSLYNASLSASLLPTPGQLNAPPVIIDKSWGRPPRINQYTVSLQREVARGLLVEAAWVANRGVWLDGGGLAFPNAITDQTLAAAGLNLNNSTDRTLLTSSITAPAVVARGFKLPYPTFPTTASLAQSLRPYPQFSGGLTARNASLGDSWYDSLQIKVTKRNSHGLDFTSSFTWSKELSRTGSFNDPINRVNQKRLSAGATPFVWVTGLNYETQKWGTNKLIKTVVGGWTVGALLRYSSGTVLGIPSSANGLNNQNFRGGTVQNRVAGEPLYLKDLGCGCIDPNGELVLNPKAWAEVPAGQWGTSAAAYNDFRSQRVADEQISFGRSFRLGERKTLSIRGEFFNVFNRTILPAPGVGSPTASTTRDSLGRITGGFGFINPNNTGQPRNGQLVGRFTF